MPTSKLARMSRLFYHLSGLFLVLIVVGVIAPDAMGIDIRGTSRLPAGHWPVNIWAGAIVGLVPFVFSLLALKAMRCLFRL